MDECYARSLIPRFILVCYCPVCQQQVEADLTILGKPGPCFQHVSLLCRSPEVKIYHDRSGSPLYIHRLCGSLLLAEQARPVLNRRIGVGHAL